MLPARVFAFMLLIAMLFAGRAHSAVVTNLSQGHLSAHVMFDVIPGGGGEAGGGETFTITLSNTSASDVLYPDQVITGVFFNSRVALNLTPVSARIAGGSTMLFGPAPAGGNIGGEWAYRTFAPGESGYAYGIGASGLSLFGPAERFDETQNLGGPASPGGIDFGLVSLADDPATGNHPVTGKTPLIQHAAVFTFTGLPEGFDPVTDLLGLRVEYGSNMVSPYLATAEKPEFFTVIPAPGSFWSGVVLLVIGCVMPRIRRKG